MKKKKIDSETADVIIKTAIAFAGCLLAMGLIWCFLRSFGNFVQEEREKEAERKAVVTREVEIESLSLLGSYEGNVTGGFVLGCGSVRGSVSEERYYIAYEVLSDGGKKLFKMPADITVVYDSLKPGEKAYAEIDENYYGLIAIRLYVPKGTITQDYDLSLE